MTKDEFLSMLDKEIDKLSDEYSKISATVQYYKETNYGGRELKEAEFQISMIQHKISMLRQIIALPAYARIQAMSDVEIEEYKKGKIDELELKIKEVQSREEIERSTLDQLKAERDRLIAQYGTLSADERESLITKGQQLNTQILSYDGKFATNQKEISELKKEQEQIKNMTSLDIKQKLSSEIKEKDQLVYILKHASEPIEASTELLASVASDPIKAQKMAQLLSSYKVISNNQEEVSGYLSLGFGLPSALVDKLTRYHKYYQESTGYVYDPDKLMEFVQEFEKSFEQEKASFNEQFTEEKLLKLVGREYGVDSSEVDMGFLQQHTDKVEAARLEYLKSLVEQKNNLSNKFFKSKNTKSQIEYLNNTIKQELSEIYRQIIGWYQSQSRAVLGLHSNVVFYSKEALQDSLKRCESDITDAEKSIDEVKAKILSAKAEMERRRQMYETSKLDIVKEIRALGGDKYKDTDIPYADTDEGYNLSAIRASNGMIYQRDFIDKVQQEAQNQADRVEADIKEAESKGITLEELLKKREETKAMVDEAVSESTDANVSPSMKH